MLLTDCEREFLAAFIYEATTDPFQGPATEELHRRNIYYTDLSHLIAAYYRESFLDQEGFGGKRILRRLLVLGSIEKPPFVVTAK